MSTTTTALEPQYRPEQVEPQIALRWEEARAFHAEPGSGAEAGPGSPGPSDPSAPAPLRPFAPAGEAGPPYSIVIPPPNVTAPLHLGHALNNTLQDILIRWRRMAGDNAMWMPGTDHAGIATQTVVEKRVLQDEGRRRTDFERGEFVERIQAWKDEYEQRITEQLRLMGCSCDWDRRRFTMDEQCARAVREAFFRLFRDGLIYRGKRLVNWDPVTRTALADDEVETQDVDGNFYYMRYPLLGPALADGTNHVTVATTRPETMLGDTAVAVNPSDPRAGELRGRRVLLPIVNREIPIIEDAYVVLPDPDSDDARARFASGFLKVTPAHDPNDWEIGQRHGLQAINVMAPDASISPDHGWPEDDWQRPENEAGFLVGKSREEARKLVVRFFKDHEMMGEIKPYRHAVGHSYRSHVPIEPYLSDQWYLKVTDEKLRGEALRALAPEQRSEDAGQRSDGESESWEGGLRFYPARYAKTYETWLENLRDWCISRQLWWGHRIPVWSLKRFASTPDPNRFNEFQEKLNTWESEGRIARYARSTDAEDPDSRGVFICVRDADAEQIVQEIEGWGYEQDPDVLDTWFSSGLWPLSTMGWPRVEGNDVLATWNPTNVLCTAREIITLWVVRMVQFNLYFHDRLPFRDVFIHAMIQDGFGQKMSKSLGNGVDPIDLIHSHGADAMRFTLASMTTHTQDVRMPVDTVDPHTGDLVHPKTITTKSGHKVAAPVQEHKGRKFVSSYGVASGEAQPTDEAPLARNTSEKFDLGQRFANKLWNAVRFALENLSDAAGGAGEPTVADKWILSRLAQTVRRADEALRDYEFAAYAQGLYDFFWRDLCDWYIEAVKPTVRSNAAQRATLATCIDVSLRLLHPVMPFVTERLWEALNETCPTRGVEGVDAPPGDLLIRAAWPVVDAGRIDAGAAAEFELIRRIVGAVREVRTTHKVPPRRKLDVSARAPADLADRTARCASFISTLANVGGFEIGAERTKPEDAAVSVVGDVELYVHGLGRADSGAEQDRKDKRIAELQSQRAALRGRLANKKYVEKAPPHLVQETRDQLAAVENELNALE